MEAKFQVLFLGTGNCARSIMAEALLDKLGRGRFHAHSAGSHPTDHVHPLALELIERMGFVEEDFRCKSWHEYTAPDAPELDMVITVCEHADREGKLKWPGNPVAVHWAVADPLKLSQDEEILRPAFRQVFHTLNDWIGRLVALPVHQLERDDVAALVGKIPKTGSARQEE
jgi:arsenate reductase (thioredoxin)